MMQTTMMRVVNNRPINHGDWFTFDGFTVSLSSIEQGLVNAYDPRAGKDITITWKTLREQGYDFIFNSPNEPPRLERVNGNLIFEQIEKQITVKVQQARIRLQRENVQAALTEWLLKNHPEIQTDDQLSFDFDKDGALVTVERDALDG